MNEYKNQNDRTEADTDGSGNLFKVTLTSSKRDLLWHPSQVSMLELIESGGIYPPSSCRMGTCGTCESTVLSGTFEYDPEPFIESSPGNVFICCAKPTSDMELDL